MTRRGFSLIELLIVLAILGLLAALALPLYANLQARARLAKAQADTRTLATAVNLYAAHMGALPTALSQITVPAMNASGAVLGPHVTTIPSGPAGWGSYAYSPDSTTGTFTITNAGDGTSVAVP